MRALPPAATEVVVPDCFAPSALGTSGACRLRLIVASLRHHEGPERLLSGPEAAVGTLLHRVLERVGHGTTASATEVFQEEYDRAVDRLRRDPRRSHFAELASIKSLAEWSRLKAWVLAQAMPSGAPSASGPSGAAVRALSGSEVGLESKALRLRGKADRVRRLGPGRFEVCDFKTGATLNDQGEVKPEIALQLGAYGLILLDGHKGADVRLLVDDGQVREIPFDTAARRAARDVLCRIIDAMPPAGLVEAKVVASPGASCYRCAIRHVCPTYREVAPTWWKQYPPDVDRLSNDIGGVVTEVTGTDTVSIVLRDDAGRRVRIDGVDGRHGISSALFGRRMWFFGLEATGSTRGFDGARFHPRSFHELPRDRLERRAWTLEVFLDTERPT